MTITEAKEFLRTLWNDGLMYHLDDDAVDCLRNATTPQKAKAIQKAVDEHKRKNSIATVVLKEVAKDEVFKYGVVSLDNDNKITVFQEKPQIEDAVSNLANTGIYIFEPEIFNYIPKDQQFDIGGDLLPLLAQNRLNIYGVNIPFEWVDIGNITDFYTATSKILKGEIKGYRIHAKEIKKGIFVG